MDVALLRQHEALLRRAAAYQSALSPMMRTPELPKPDPPKLIPRTYGICHAPILSAEYFGEECGRKISRNKTRCGRCYRAALQRVAEDITPEQLAEYLKDMEPLDRLEVTKAIRPYLKVELPPGGGTKS